MKKYIYKDKSKKIIVLSSDTLERETFSGMVIEVGDASGIVSNINVGGFSHKWFSEKFEELTEEEITCLKIGCEYKLPEESRVEVFEDTIEIVPRFEYFVDKKPLRDASNIIIGDITIYTKTSKYTKSAVTVITNSETNTHIVSFEIMRNKKESKYDFRKEKHDRESTDTEYNVAFKMLFKETE